MYTDKYARVSFSRDFHLALLEYTVMLDSFSFFVFPYNKKNVILQPFYNKVVMSIVFFPPFCCEQEILWKKKLLYLQDNLVH